MPIGRSVPTYIEVSHQGGRRAEIVLWDQSLNCRQPYDGFVKAVLGSRSTKARRETSSPVLDQDSTSTWT